MRHRVVCMGCGKAKRLTLERASSGRRRFVHREESDGWAYFGEIDTNSQFRSKYLYEWLRDEDGNLKGLDVPRKERTRKISNPRYDPKAPERKVELWECPECLKEARAQDRRENPEDWPDFCPYCFRRDTESKGFGTRPVKVGPEGRRAKWFVSQVVCNGCGARGPRGEDASEFESRELARRAWDGLERCMPTPRFSEGDRVRCVDKAPMLHGRSGSVLSSDYSHKSGWHYEVEFGSDYHTVNEAFLELEEPR